MLADELVFTPLNPTGTVPEANDTQLLAKGVSTFAITDEALIPPLPTLSELGSVLLSILLLGIGGAYAMWRVRQSNTDDTC